MVHKNQLSENLHDSQNAIFSKSGKRMIIKLINCSKASFKTHTRPILVKPIKKWDLFMNSLFQLDMLRLA